MSLVLPPHKTKLHSFHSDESLSWVLTEDSRQTVWSSKVEDRDSSCHLPAPLFGSRYTTEFSEPSTHRGRDHHSFCMACCTTLPPLQLQGPLAPNHLSWLAGCDLSWGQQGPRTLEPTADTARVLSLLTACVCGCWKLGSLHPKPTRTSSSSPTFHIPPHCLASDRE